MVNKIHALRHVLVKDEDSKNEPEKRSIFQYIILESDRNIIMDAEGHCTLDEAYEIAKDRFTTIIMKYGLKEAINVINLSNDELKTFNVNNKDEIYDLVFDKNILDDNSSLYKNLKKILMDHWDDQLEPIYYVCDYAKSALIHDDKDKKTLKNHYFDLLTEFNNHVSFLEYFNNNVVPEMLIPNGFNIQMCNGYSELYPDYYIIDDTITRKELQEFLNKYNVPLDIEIFRQSVIWAAFGYYFGIKNGLTDTESKGFASMLNKEFSSFRTKDLNFGVEDNFKGELIEKIIYQIGFGKYTQEERTKIKFYSLFDLFKNRIRDFEYKNMRLEFRVSQRQYDKFMALEGKSKADKLDNLMNNGELIKDSKISDINFNNGGINRWLKQENQKFWDDFKLNDSNFSELTYEYLHGESKEIIELDYEEGYLSPDMKMINEELASMTPEDWELEMKMMDQYDMEMEMMEEFENMTPEDMENEMRIMELSIKEQEEQEETMKMAEEMIKLDAEIEKQKKEQEETMKMAEEMARLDAEIEKLKQEKKRREENNENGRKA